jgi:DNA polymerase III sliding clamp (beta) subunit (PCNA family)
MQIRVERLREALDLLKPAVSGKKAALPITQNVLLKDGSMMATNLEIWVTLDMPEAEEACLIPHKAVSELLKHVPGSELLTITVKRRALDLSWDGGGATYDVDQPDDYPPVPEVQVTAEGNLDGDRLVKALAEAIPYCSTDEKRPVLCGVTLFLGKQVAVGASDGYRMTYQELPLGFPSEETAIIPSHIVKVLDHLWGKAPSLPPLASSLIEQVTARRQLSLALGNGRLKITFGRVTVFAQLIQGTPPSYVELFPKEAEVVSQAHIFAPEFEHAVQRVKDIARDTKDIIRLTWNEAALTMAAMSEDKGKVETKVPLVGEGTPGKVALNVSYLLDYLRSKQGVITIGVKDEQSPVLLRHSSSPLVLIMPMVVQW